MANVSHAMQAKSDQLNYVDIGNGEMTITVTAVNVTNSDQPISIFYENSGDRPYKPSKGMIRAIVAAWGEESDCWVGKSIKLYGDPSVKWAGKEVGGLRIKAFSHIADGGFDAYVAISRGLRRKTHFDLLVIGAQTLPALTKERAENAILWGHDTGADAEMVIAQAEKSSVVNDEMRAFIIAGMNKSE